MKNLLEDFEPEDLQRALQFVRPFPSEERWSKLRELEDAGEISRELCEVLSRYFQDEASPELRLGSVFGKYTITELLGEGGMGRVYQAWDRDLMRNVAVKLIRPDLIGLEDEYRERGLRPPEELFREETGALARLQHSGIVSIYERGIAETAAGIRVPYCAMELVYGDSITRYCQDRRLGSDAILDLFRQVCAAVGYAHSRQVVHRDLKPGNILIDHAGQPRILDFGLAVVLNRCSPVDLLALGMGSPGYLAPEQISHGFGKIGYATDVFALGVIFYELLGKRRPGPADPRQPSYRPALLSEVPQRLGLLDPELAGEIEEIAATCLEKSPEDRYANANVLHSVLTACLDKRRLSLLARELGLGRGEPAAAPLRTTGAAAAPPAARGLEPPEIATVYHERPDFPLPGACKAAPPPLPARRSFENEATDIREPQPGSRPAPERRPSQRPRSGSAADPGRGKRILVWSVSGAVSLAGAALIAVGLIDRFGDREPAATEEGIARLQEALGQGLDLLTLERQLSQGSGEIAPAPPPPSADPDEGDPAGLERRYLEGIAHVEKGQHGQALAAFADVVAQSPHYKEANINMAVAYLRLGQHEDALRKFDEVIARNPDANVAYIMRGQCHFRIGNLGEAIADYSEFIRLTPDYADAYNMRGQVHLLRDEFDKAEADFARMIALQPGSSISHEFRGRARIGQGRYEEAIQDLNRAAEINPRDADIFYHRSIARSRLGNATEAESDLARALQLNPSLRRPEE